VLHAVGKRVAEDADVVAGFDGELGRLAVIGGQRIRQTAKKKQSERDAATNGREGANHAHGGVPRMMNRLEVADVRAGLPQAITSQDGRLGKGMLLFLERTSGNHRPVLRSLSGLSCTWAMLRDRLGFWSLVSCSPR